MYIHYRIVKIEGLHKIYMLHYCIFIATICEIMVPFNSTKAPKELMVCMSETCTVYRPHDFVSLCKFVLKSKQ